MTQTPAERRVAAAKERERKAKTALLRAYETKHAAIEAATKKHQPKVWAALRKYREARAAVTLAELAAHGITPMQTIIECTPAFSEWRGRFVVRIGHEGRATLVPVGARGAVLKHRNEKRAPWKWSDARITGETLKGE